MIFFAAVILYLSCFQLSAQSMLPLYEKGKIESNCALVISDTNMKYNFTFERPTSVLLDSKSNISIWHQIPK